MHGHKTPVFPEGMLENPGLICVDTRAAPPETLVSSGGLPLPKFTLRKSTQSKAVWEVTNKGLL